MGSLIEHSWEVVCMIKVQTAAKKDFNLNKNNTKRF